MPRQLLGAPVGQPLGRGFVQHEHGPGLAGCGLDPMEKFGGCAHQSRCAHDRLEEHGRDLGAVFAENGLKAGRIPEIGHVRVRPGILLAAIVPVVERLVLAVEGPPGHRASLEHTALPRCVLCCTAPSTWAHFAARKEK